MPPPEQQIAQSPVASAAANQDSAGASGDAVAEASITGSLPSPSRQLNGAPACGGDTCAARAARSWRELLITGWLHVSHLVHGLAQPGKFGVHPPPRAVGVAERLVLGKAVPRVVTEHVRERE